MRRYVVIKSWKDAGPTASPDYRLWSGCVEDRTVLSADSELDEHEESFRARLVAAGFIVAGVYDEPCCDHEITGDAWRHCMDDCDHLFLAATVRLPAKTERDAYELACAAMGLEPATA